jgi:hydrogenase nickel incorporation protein HypA/HybF
MHEFNVCQSIVAMVHDNLDNVNSAVTRVTVTIGALRPIVPEYLVFAYTCLTEGTIAEGSELVIRRLPVQGKCSRCGTLHEVVKLRFLCKQCGADTGTIVGGRELYIEHIELQEFNRYEPKERCHADNFQCR